MTYRPGTHEGHLLGDGHLEGRVREPLDRLWRTRPPTRTISLTVILDEHVCDELTRLVSIVHGQGDSGSLEIVHVHDDLVSTINRGIDQFQLSRPGGDKVGGFVLFRKKKGCLYIKGISPGYETSRVKGSIPAVPDRRTRDVR